MRSILPVCLCLVSFLAAQAGAQVPYETVPDWLSTETSDYGTGCDFGDVNGDGYLDLAVSNGNDIVEAPNYVYLNDAGVLPTSASWISTDLRYSGHCELADINGDGFPEFMVANYIAGDWLPAQVQLYANTAGLLSASPTWESATSFYSFRATFGDPDGDGDLDLAVATGESYHGIDEPNYIFFNVGGALQTTPGWISADSDACYDVQFVDVDQDGDLDLAFLPSGDPVKIYFNVGGVIQTTPGWQSAAAGEGNTFDFADVNGDGYPDLGVANNNQLGGDGRFRIYLSDGGLLSPTAAWESDSGGYGSAAVFVDIDSDGDQDFVGGRWWGLIQVHLNAAGSYPGSPDWTSSSAYQSVIENIVFGDVDGGQEILESETFAGDGLRKLFYLPDRHLQSIETVVADGVELPRTAYCHHLQAGRVSMATAPLQQVTVNYRNSRAKDMAVTNWDGATYLFTHDNVTAVARGAGVPDPAAIRHGAYPNPFNPQTMILYTLPAASRVCLDVFDVRGRKIATLVNADQAAGEHAVPWNASGLASGTYLYCLRVGESSFAGKICLVK